MESNLIDPRPIRTRLINRREGWGFLLKDQQQKLLSPVHAFKIMPEASKTKTIRISSRSGNILIKSVNSTRKEKTVANREVTHVNFNPPKPKEQRAQSQRIPERKRAVSYSCLIIPAPSFGPQMSSKAWVRFLSLGNLWLQPRQHSDWVSKYKSEGSSFSDKTIYVVYCMQYHQKQRHRSS
jgi:hypothetical protein